MTRDEAYRQAEEKIEEARKMGAYILDLSDSPLEELPESIGKLTDLKELYLHNTQLTSVPESLGNLTNLETLRLDSTPITSVPEILDKLIKLQRLDLDNTQLMSVPESLGKLTNLQILFLNDTPLTSLPKSLGKLTNLQTLDLSGTQLTSIPESLGKLSNLQTLFLRNTPLTSLPESLFKLTNLQKLFLNDTHLTSLPESLGKLTNLQTLALYSTPLASVPESLGKLTNLQTFDLSGTPLTSIPESLGKLTNLQTFDLSDTQLTSIPESLGKLTNLQELYLSNTPLTLLPESFRQLTHLKGLYLHGNPGLNLPPEILGPTWEELRDVSKEPASPESILAYYFRPKKPLNEARLILVGFGDVGKSSLVKRLVTDNFDPHEAKTEGIQITEWKVFPPGREEIKLRIWDFGGQEIMHSTHQFFLSHRSLYLLVLNGRQGHEDRDAEYWMHLIRSFGGDSPVIVLLNKQREHPFDLNRPQLQAKFPGMIKAFLSTECADPPQQLDRLKECIAREIGELKGIADGFPAEWFAIKDRLASMPENYLTFEEYQKICEELGESLPSDQDRLAEYLHRLGVALNYKEDPRLRDMHVLNPRWVTEGIYSILNARALTESKGELDLSALSSILDSAKYPPARHVFLLNLMRKFHLCFEFPDREGHYFIPDLADKNEPVGLEEFAPAKGLNFRYEYESLHEGIVPSFITRTYILSEGRPRWRFGVILAFEGCRALVRGNISDRQISITVIGPSAEGRRRLLAIIRSHFEEIHRQFTTPPKELVSPSQYPEIAISYRELKVLEKKGIAKKQAIIGEEVLDLDVVELLNGVDLPEAPAAAGEKAAIKLFYSYSHKDEALREELNAHLTIFKRRKMIQEWHDRCISPGEKWADAIDRHLEEADIILLLISADFIESDYCYVIEMTRALERHAAGEATAIPIILRECHWKDADFADLQALPKDGMPVDAHERRDTAWTEIARRLEAVIQEKLEKKEKPGDSQGIERIKEEMR